MIEGPYRTRSSFNPDSWAGVVFLIIGCLFLIYSAFFYYSNKYWPELAIALLVISGGAAAVIFGGTKLRIAGLIGLLVLGIATQGLPEPPAPISKHFSR
jgi:hypothetical protein